MSEAVNELFTTAIQASVDALVERHAKDLDESLSVASRATALAVRLGEENEALKTLAAAQLDSLDSLRATFAQLAEEMRSLPDEWRFKLNGSVCLISRTLFGSITPPKPGTLIDGARS